MPDQQPRPVPETAAPRRSTQYALVFLAGAAVALIGQRLLVDRRMTHPTEMQRSDSLSVANDSDRKPAKPTRKIDLNKAERHELMLLPGIGPSMADGILAYRDANGPFQRVEDLRSVRGIGATTLEKLKPWLILDPTESDEPLRLERKPTSSKPTSGKKQSPAEPIDLNRATQAAIESLPGIGPTLAQRILDEREKKPFAKLDDLRRVNGIGPKRLEQMRMFVVVRP